MEPTTTPSLDADSSGEVERTRSGAIGAVVWGALLGGIVLLVGAFVALHPLVTVAAALLLFASVATVGLLAVREARREGVGFWQAVGRGVFAAFRWLAYVLP